MAKVTINDVTKRFGSLTAVDNITLEIDDGEMIVLVGPSGCGKSTLLRMVAGLENVTEGEIYIGDRKVNDVAPKDRDIAMVFQNYALYPHMTIYDNIAFGLKLRKFPKADIADRVHNAASMLGIEDKLKQKPGQLSGGQRQRVAVGRAIVREPKVFLFDEPLSNLDAKLRVHMRVELQELHNTLQATTIYVTHDQIEAMTLGQRVAVLKPGGVLQQFDTPQKLYDEPANVFVGGFIGSPAMNFLPGNLEETNEVLYCCGDAFELPIEGGRASQAKAQGSRACVAGIRPEDFRLCTDTEHGAMRVNVKVVEPLGSEQMIYGDVGETEVVVRLEPDQRVSVGQQIDLAVNLDKMHLFDQETESSLFFQAQGVS